MKYLLYIFMSIFSLIALNSKGQAIKTNVPLTLAGTPNLGFEFTIGDQFAVNIEGLWAPYLSKESESVLRVFQSSIDFRFYLNPRYYHNNNIFDGWYCGPYAMYGNFNIGFNKEDPVHNNDRYVGWGVSTGISGGYKMYLSRRFRLDFNLGLGYAHLQYDVYRLGKEWAESPYLRKETKAWIGPTKFGIHLVFNLNKN